MPYIGKHAKVSNILNQIKERRFLVISNDNINKKIIDA